VGVVDELVGKALRGLKSLQVSGFSRLDGGLLVNGGGDLQGGFTIDRLWAGQPHRLRVTRSGSTSLTNGTFAKVPLDTIDYDTASGFDLPSNTYTFQRPGYYQVILRVSTSTAPGSINVRGNKNSGTFIMTQKESAAVAAAHAESSDIQFFNLGDTLSLEVMEDNATGALTVTGLMVIHFMSNP